MPRQIRAVQRAAASFLKDGMPSMPSGAYATFKPRRTFALPNHVPSWYAGHMYRAMRSLPALLARQPPPLIIEARDARLPLSSVNPAFEEMLMQMEKSTNKKAARAGGEKDARVALHDARAWRRRRLVVYNKADLIDARLYAPIRDALARHEEGQDVMFVDSRSNADVQKVMHWARKRASRLAREASALSAEEGEASKSSDRFATPRPARAQNLSGAFRHTSTPEEGVRLVILGMPNVGKSSLLNALRRVGTGGAKAASTAPEPGHTRKLTGTVRITKKTTDDTAADHTALVESKKKDGLPAIYVYDTPGVMVPYLGGGVSGAEKGVKLAVAAGIKSSLFDAIGLADYLLFRLNLKWLAHLRAHTGDEAPPLPAYMTGLPLGASFEPTNDVHTLLDQVALRAPGTLSKGGERDLDAAAAFMLDRWRNGKLGSGELDTGAFEWSPEHDARQTQWSDDDVRACVDRAVARHFAETHEARQQGVATSARPVRGADRASRRKMEQIDWLTLREQHQSDKRNTTTLGLMSKRQARIRSRTVENIIRENRLRDRGVRVEGLARTTKGKQGVQKVDRQAAVRARRTVSARGGRRMAKHGRK